MKVTIKGFIHYRKEEWMDSGVYSFMPCDMTECGYVNVMPHEIEVEVPDDWTRVANLLFKRKTRKLVEGSDRVRIEGKQRTVRVVGRVASDIVATSENVIVEVLKNGPVSRQIRSTGTVVDFSRR